MNGYAWTRFIVLFQLQLESETCVETVILDVLGSRCTRVIIQWAGVWLLLSAYRIYLLAHANWRFSFGQDRRYGSGFAERQLLLVCRRWRGILQTSRKCSRIHTVPCRCSFDKTLQPILDSTHWLLSKYPQTTRYTTITRLTKQID